MQWVQVQIEGQCDIICYQCSHVLIDLKDVEICGEWTDRIKGKQIFGFVPQLKIHKEKFRLDSPQLSNEPSHFLMYLQSIKCSFCLKKVGIFFKTVNSQNMFALNKYAFDLGALKLKDQSQQIKQIILQMFRQELDKSKQPMAKKEYKQRHQRKEGPSIEQQLSTVDNIQRSIIQKGLKVKSRIIKEIQERRKSSSNK